MGAPVGGCLDVGSDPVKFLRQMDKVVLPDFLPYQSRDNPFLLA